MRVIGKDGKFVTDLALPDFEITEDGVPQKIQSVVLIEPRRSRFSTLSTSSTSTLSTVSTLAPLAPRPHQVWVFVFDTNHLTAGSLQRARDGGREVHR